MTISSKEIWTTTMRLPKAAIDRGFTLVELVVTLVIIGVLAAVSAPIFFTTQNFQQSGEYNAMLASVRYAQKLAVATGCAVQVQITANSYTFSQVPPASAATCNTPPYSTSVTDPSNPGNAYTRTSSVALTPTTFVFCPLGNVAAVAGSCPSESTGNITVTVGSQTITIVRTTGHICNATSAC